MGKQISSATLVRIKKGGRMYLGFVQGKWARVFFRRVTQEIERNVRSPHYSCRQWRKIMDTKK